VFDQRDDSHDSMVVSVVRDRTGNCHRGQTLLYYSRTEEAATYLATYKAFEHKPPDLLKERVHKDYASRLQGVLTSVRGINKTDVMTLSTNFGVS
jgi:DNA excision repair protein ERCC-1